MTVPSVSDASFLGLPPELRVRIYEQIVRSTNLRMYPIAYAGRCRGVWALPRVCRVVQCEVLPLLPRMSDLTLELHGFGKAALDRWLASMGPVRMLEIQRITLSAKGDCRIGSPTSCLLDLADDDGYMASASLSNA